MVFESPSEEADVDRPQRLTREECLELLSGCSLGRVAFTERALPAIRPVRYALVGHQLVLSTQAEGLGRRLDGQVVAFEVDDIDAAGGSGRSVVVMGTARLLRSPGELMRLAADPLVSMTGGSHDARICIVPGEITGRRIQPTVDAA